MRRVAAGLHLKARNLQPCGKPHGLPHSGPMLKRFRASLKSRKKQKELSGRLDRLAQKYPGIDWKPFQELTHFFSDKSMSALEEQAFLYRLATQLPRTPPSSKSAVGSATAPASLASPCEARRLVCTPSTPSPALPRSSARSPITKTSSPRSALTFPNVNSSISTSRGSSSRTRSSPSLPIRPRR